MRLADVAATFRSPCGAGGTAVGARCALWRPKGRRYVVLALLIATSAQGQNVAPTAAAPVTVTTSVEPKRVTIGTPFRYTMRIEAGADVELMVPILSDRIGEFVITDFGEVPHDKSDGRAVVERWYTLVTYDTGDHIVPGAPIQYRVPGSDLQRTDAPDALVIVDSLLAKSPGAQDIRDIHGPVAVPRDYTVLWMAAAIVAAGAGVGYGLYRWLSRRRAAQFAPPRPAHEIALEALAKLQRAGLIEAGRHDEYWVRLSAIVRNYLEGRFQLRAPEMTTEEFLQAAQRNPQIEPGQRALLSRFLAEADLVKFARYVPGSEDAEGAYASAREFVEHTAVRAEVARAAA